MSDRAVMGEVLPSDESELVARVEARVGWVILNRPGRKNALTVPMREAFLHTIHEFDERDDIRCIVVEGAGGAFCAGADIAVQAEQSKIGADTVRQMLDYLSLPGSCALALLRCRKPTVAALDGPAAGAGASMALLCDIRIGSPRAFFLVPFLDRGLVPDWLLMRILPAYVGIGRSMDIFHGQERIAAEAAASLGLLSAVHDEGSFHGAVKQMAERLAALPPLAVEFLKANLRSQLGDLDAALVDEALAQAVCLDTEDHAEGARAFLDRRRPVFVGR